MRPDSSTPLWAAIALGAIVLLALGVALWLGSGSDAAPGGDAAAVEGRGPAPSPRLAYSDDAPPSVTVPVTATRAHADAGRATADDEPTAQPPQLLGTLDAGADARAQVQRQLAENAAAATKYVDRFCEESKLLRAPPGPAETRKNDASSFLTVRIDWEDNTRPPGLLHLPEALRARLKGYQERWPAAITDADLAGLDFSWMSQLHQFDHWNLLAEGPLRESRDTDFYRAPIPNFVELQLWTKLRVARALRERDFEAASADIHQLVALLRSTGLVIADLIGVSLLSLERSGLESASAVPPGLVFSAEETARERRVGRSAMYFTQPGVSPEVMKKAMACNAHFRCSALSEGLGAHVTLAGISAPGTLDTVASMADGAGCNPEMLAWIRRAGQRTPAEALGTLGLPPSMLERLFGADAGR